MKPTRKTLLHSDIQLSYLEWDRGTKPLLLLHGLADHALVWSSLGAYLAQDYHIVAPDLRGHGDTTKPKHNYSFATVIADLEALMDKLGWSTTHVVAHSWSGKLAAIWATQHPQRLHSMVLVDPIFIWKMPSFLKLTFPFLYRVLPFLKGMGPFPSYEEAEQQAKQLNQYQGWTALQQQVFQAGIEAKSDGTWGSKFTTSARDEIFLEVMRVAGLTTSIDISTLFVQPEKGVNRMEWQLQPYKKFLKNLQICPTPGNHWCFLTQPEEFNHAVTSFLNTQNLRKLY